MRWVYLAIVILILAAIVIFAAQNTGSADVAFLTWAVSAPIAVVVFVAYVLGAATGGSLYALILRSVRGSRGGSSRT
jgi:lipopolysaccharide assembly protein A